MARADEDGIYSFELAPRAENLLSKDERGYWIAGLQLTIDAHQGSFNQLYFWYLVRFVVRDSTCEMHIDFDKQQFTFRVDDAEKRKAAFDYMVQLVKQMFALKPWESVKKASIGFVTPSGS